MVVTWNILKNFVQTRNVSPQFVDLADAYWIKAFDGPFSLECNIPKNGNDDQTDFEDHFKDHANKSPRQETVGQMEKDDKTLRCVCAFTVTDSNGSAKFAIPVPSKGRYIAYGDAEFESRSFGDYVAKIEVVDLDRLIAWQVAFAMDSNATEPLPDEAIQAAGNQIPGGPFPLYPILGFYDEKNFAEELPENALGNPRGGMAMTFAYGSTEVQPVGGYGFIYEGFYLCIEVQKSTAVSGVKCQLSIDWAAPV